MQGTDDRIDRARIEAPARQRMRWWIARLNVEMAGELILLALTGAFFVYLLLESRDWPPGAALMPRIVSSAGLVFWALRVFMLVRGQTGRPNARIMDTGFTEADSFSPAVLRRFLTITGSLVALLAGIWFAGWHITLPAYVFLYMLFVGRVRWWWAALAAAAFLALLFGVYDAIFHTPWNEPALLRLIE
jgi:hypothetical protein